MIEVHRTTRDALDAILAAHLGHPAVITRDAHGKPVCDGIHFNLSHSGAVVLIAVGPDPLGVDVEQRDPRRDVVALARRFFTPAEAAEVAIEPQRFWRLWCRKEAWLKARGVGLVFPLDTDLRGDLPGWLLADLDVGNDYAAALACEHGGDFVILDDARSEAIRRAGESVMNRPAR